MLIIIFLSEPWPPGVVQHSVPLVIMMITPLRWGLRKMTMMNMMRERSPVPLMSCMLAPYKNNATTAGITEMGKYTGTQYYTILYYTSSPSIINCLINSCSLKVHREINGSPSPCGSRGHPRQQPQTERGSSSRAKRQENLRWAADLSLSEGDAPAHWQEQITHLQKQLHFSTTMCQTLLQDQQVSECTKLGMHQYISQ